MSKVNRNQTMAQRYTTWSSMEFWEKKFFITMFRKRFSFKENIELEKWKECIKHSLNI